MRKRSLLLMWMGWALGACASAQDMAVSKPEVFLLLPEPRAARTAASLVLGGAKLTVFSPAQQSSDKSTIQVYPAKDFAKLGISPETFAKKALAAADRLLASLKPELIRDEAGRVRYAVYRGESSIYACLLVAPSLAKTFEPVFGKEIWVAAPDRHALYIFPPNPLVVDDFAADLEDRFDSNAYSASEEVFVMRSDTGGMRAVGTFTDR